MARVTTENPDNLPLAGMMVKTILERNADDPKVSRVMDGMNGDVALFASQMQIGLSFASGEVRISPELPSAPKATLSAPIDAFLNVGLRKRLISTAISRRVKVKGDPIFLLKLARRIFEDQIDDMSKKKVQTELEKILGSERVASDQADLVEFSEDMTENPSGKPDFVAKATSTEEIVEIVKLANKESVPITPRVAGTNLGGLAIPAQGGIVLDLREMNKIISVNEDEMYALIEPGVTFGDIKQYLDQNHPNLRMGYSLSPPYTSVICNMLLDGLSNLSHKHGSMAEWLNTVEAVMPTGEVMKAGAGALSDTWFARGPLPDLMGLFINWQGTTGIVTKAAVQLWPQHEHRGRYFILTYDPESSFSMVRKFARMEILDDIGCLSWPTGKMLLGNENPTYRDPTEPEFFVYVDISAPSKNLLKEKVALTGEVVEGYQRRRLHDGPPGRGVGHRQAESRVRVARGVSNDAQLSFGQPRWRVDLGRNVWPDRQLGRGLSPRRRDHDQARLSSDGRNQSDEWRSLRGASLYRGIRQVRPERR